MIDYEEELKKFEPCLDVTDAEEAIYDRELTDILDESTELLCCGAKAKEYIIDAFDLKEDSEKMILKGVVSRKKQLIPVLVETMQQM